MLLTRAQRPLACLTEVNMAEGNRKWSNGFVRVAVQLTPERLELVEFYRVEHGLPAQRAALHAMIDEAGWRAVGGSSREAQRV